MKRNLLITAALLATFTLANQKAKAQDVRVTGDVPLSITLDDAFSIALGSDPEVAFSYTTAADYAGSKDVEKLGHFTIVSNKTYSVAVAAKTEFTTLANDTPVPLSVVEISVEPSTTATGTYAMQPLTTTTAKNIITEGTPTVGTPYDILYKIPTAQPLLDKVSGTYSTNVFYTVTQQ